MKKNILLNRIKELSSPVYPESVGHDTHFSSLSRIKCVAFDFYGTMFISAAGDIGIDENKDEGNIRFFKEALRHCNFNILDKSAGKKGIGEFQKVIDRHIDEMKEQGVDHPEPDIREVFFDVLTALHRKNLIRGDVTEDIATLFAIEFEFRSNAIWPLPDLLTDLEELKKRGLALGIISNSQFYSPVSFEAMTSITIDKFGFVPALQKWSFKYGIKKPSLSFYRLFIDELPQHDLQPEEVLYIGNDLNKDVLPAKHFGMKTALYVGDRRSIRHQQEDLIDKHLPDIMIDELSQIKDCLE